MKHCKFLHNVRAILHNMANFSCNVDSSEKSDAINRKNAYRGKSKNWKLEYSPKFMKQAEKSIFVSAQYWICYDPVMFGCVHNLFGYQIVPVATFVEGQ